MLVGRDREMAACRAALVAASRGTGGVVLLTGEAGIGKTHLLSAAIEEARTLGFDIASGRCFGDAGQPPFAPWREALGDTALPGAGTRHESRSGERSRRGSLGAQGDRARIFESVLDDLARRVDTRPMLVAIDDLHWADRESALLFLHVVRFGLQGPLLLAGSVRTPDLDGARNAALDEVLAELAREPRCERLVLRPFSTDEVAEVASATAHGILPQAMARAIHSETGGNALYVRELVRHLLEVGKLAVHDGRLATDIAASELGLPPSVRHVVRHRASRLSETTLTLLRLASLMTGPVDVATLGHAAEVSTTTAIDAVDEAIAAGLMREASSGRFELTHAIVRRAIQEDVGSARRIALHRQLALALEASPTPDVAELAAQYHASRALAGAERGLAYALAAGESARAIAAQERAVAFLRMAADLAPPLGATAIADVELRLAIATAESLDHDAALTALQRAGTALASAGRAAELPAAAAAVARALATSGAPRATWEPIVADALTRLGSPSDEDAELIRARLMVLMNEPVPFLRGPVWVSFFRPFDPHAVEILRTRGTEIDFAATVDIHDARAHDEVDRLRERTATWTEPAAIIRVRDACARDLFFHGAFDRAEDEMLALRDLSMRVGSMLGRVGALTALGCIWASRGEIATAREVHTELRGLARRLGAMHRMNVIAPMAVSAVIGYIAGDDVSATARALVDFVSSPRATTTPFGFVALQLGVFTAALSGDDETSARLMPYALQTLMTIPCAAPEWGAGRDCVASAVWLRGDAANAQAVLDLAERSEGDQCACWSHRFECIARMKWLLGDVDGARAAHKRAREIFSKTRRAASLAIADHDEAVGLLRLGRGNDPEVRPLLDAAEGAFQRLDMAGWLARVAEARRVLEGTATSEAPRPDNLSQREVEVLVLLARGLSNKEIAAKLFISVPTVERHIANTYAKTQTHGRAAATAYALRKGLVPT